MSDELDPVARYGMALGLRLLPRTVLVEGTTDVELFRLAARLEKEATGVDLLGGEFAVVAAGEKDRGGATGVARELNRLHGIAQTVLLPNGRPRYRFVGLFDNDDAGRRAASLVHAIDSSMIAYKDVFLLRPIMPTPNTLDPGDVEHTFERENFDFKGLDWEIEDLLSATLLEAFQADHPDAVRRSTAKSGRTHLDFTADGKARLHRFTRTHAIRQDLTEVVVALSAMRYYLRVA